MELIKIENVEGKKTVDARTLHIFLEIKSRFNDWIKNRIKEYGFIEKEDYISLTRIIVTGGSAKEYHLSLDMAKELSMVERNEKGKQARKYFIDCEKRANNQIQQLTPAEMMLQSAQFAVDQERKNTEMNNRMDLIEARQTTRNEDYFTVAGYCSLNRIQVSQLQAAELGRKCAKLSREKDITIESVPDARFGRVNIYHTEILQEIVC